MALLLLGALYAGVLGLGWFAARISARQTPVCERQSRRIGRAHFEWK